jgi:glycosyltransferase involved in cell wall biosynthesis
MEATYSQFILDFLSETSSLTERVDELPQETAVELYEMYGTAARAATLSIEEIDAEFRVKLCEKQDEILERIVSALPSHPHSAGGIYTPAVHCYRRWGNVELLKDKCLTGYMLAKELGARPTMMFGTKSDDYSYKSILPNLELLYSTDEPGKPDAYLNHLLKHHSKMDILILHGMYEQTVDYLNIYRKLRPDGKVYCGLDMNRYWMQRVNWDSQAAIKFADQCDIIATSCRSLRDELNRNPKVSFSCRWFPNGFYNPMNIPVIADEERKENVILTVGRIGSAQKNNNEMLMAFAKVSKILSDWTLRLVGSIEPEFNSYIERYFETFPHLRSRVVFTGSIKDKAELYREYARAKLFVLTSQFEGGTPNVYAEALFHGCMFITSDIDGADDITNSGKLGIKYSLGSIDELASALKHLTKTADKRKLNVHIQKALKYARKYYDWNRNAKKLAYMLYN